MKKILIAALMLLWTAALLAQQETLISGEIEHGGFGGPVIKLGTLNGETSILVGGRGGWIINHTFILGGGGYGLVNKVRAKTPGPFGERYMNLGYGGVEMEYVPTSNKLVHLSLMTLLGAGAVTYRDEALHFTVDPMRTTDTFFIAEPQVNVTLNVTTFFRISAGASYRFIKGLTSVISTDGDLSGPAGMLTLRFGKF